MGEVGGAVQGIDDPFDRMMGDVLEPLLFAENLVGGKSLVNGLDDGSLGMEVGLGDEVDGLIFFVDVKSLLGIVQQDDSTLFSGMNSDLDEAIEFGR